MLLLLEKNSGKCEQMEIGSKFPECVSCMSVSDTLINIFIVNDKYSNVAATVIAELLQFEVPESDCYPNSICEKCLEKLYDFKEFKKTCLRSKDLLDKKYISNHQVELLVPKPEPEEDHEQHEDISDSELRNVPKQEEEKNEDQNEAICNAELVVTKQEPEEDLEDEISEDVRCSDEEVIPIQKQEINIDEYDPWGNRFSKEDGNKNEDEAVDTGTRMVIEEIKEQIEITENPITVGSSDDVKMSPSDMLAELRERQAERDGQTSGSGKSKSTAKLDTAVMEGVTVRNVPSSKHKPEDGGIRISRNLYSPNQPSISLEHDTGSDGGAVAEAVVPSTSHHGLECYSGNQGRSWNNYNWSIQNPYSVGTAAKQMAVQSTSRRDIASDRRYSKSQGQGWNPYSWPTQNPYSVAVPETVVPDRVYNDRNPRDTFNQTQVQNWSHYNMHNQNPFSVGVTVPKTGVTSRGYDDINANRIYNQNQGQSWNPYNVSTQVLVPTSRNTSCVRGFEPERSSVAGNSTQNISPRNTSRGTCSERKSSRGTCNEPSHRLTEAPGRIIPELVGNDGDEHVPSDETLEKLREKNKYHVTIIPSKEDGTSSEQCSATSFEECSAATQELDEEDVASKKIPYICDVCGFTTFTKLNLICHLQIHSGERPHKCSMCPKTFSRLYNLRVHEKNHLGVRNFSCGTCSKKFITHSHLRLHEKVHKKQWACTCEVCGKGFASASHLQKHKVKHTGLKPFHCDQCNRSYAYESGFKAHLNNHAEMMRRYHCSKCKRSYARQYSLKIHVCRA